MVWRPVIAIKKQYDSDNEVLDRERETNQNRTESSETDPNISGSMGICQRGREDPPVNEC